MVGNTMNDYPDCCWADHVHRTEAERTRLGALVAEVEESPDLAPDQRTRLVSHLRIGIAQLDTADARQARRRGRGAECPRECRCKHTDGMTAALEPDDFAAVEHDTRRGLITADVAFMLRLRGHHETYERELAEEATR